MANKEIAERAKEELAKGNHVFVIDFGKTEVVTSGLYYKDQIILNGEGFLLSLCTDDNDEEIDLQGEESASFNADHGIIVLTGQKCEAKFNRGIAQFTSSGVTFSQETASSKVKA